MCDCGSGGIVPKGGKAAAEINRGRREAIDSRRGSTTILLWRGPFGRTREEKEKEFGGPNVTSTQQDQHKLIILRRHRPTKRGKDKNGQQWTTKSVPIHRETCISVYLQYYQCSFYQGAVVILHNSRPVLPSIP
jgi:hypothetical protein